MAREGIEPPTQGFSGNAYNLHPYLDEAFAGTIPGVVTDTGVSFSTTPRARSRETWLYKSDVIVFP